MRNTIIAASLALTCISFGQLPVPASIPPNLVPVIYYNARSGKFGAVEQSKVGTLKKLGLDVSFLYGLVNNSPDLTSLVGTAGFSLTSTHTIRGSNIYIQGGVAATWDAGHQLGAGVIVTAGIKF